jgi:hypothetical protein
MANCFLRDQNQYTLDGMQKRQSGACLGLMLILAVGCADRRESSEEEPAPVEPLELTQAELFGAGGAYTNAWADFDVDGDPDLFVGFGDGIPNRLYRNDAGTFVDVALDLGVADLERTRGAAWGDFNADGLLDLYVGFAFDAPTGNRLYRNDGEGGFTDVAADLGLDLSGQTRQISWIDYDIDGDVDLFVAFRDQTNRLYRNDGATLTDVSEATGLADPRKAVGAVWFDFDRDGDLDVFIANQEDDPNALYRNDNGSFVDVAESLGLTAVNRREGDGSVGPCISDYDSDGRLDLFVANYGPSALYSEDSSGQWIDVAPALGLAVDTHAVSCAWGDYDNDGRPDLYMSAYVNGELHYPDHFFRNESTGFTDVITASIAQHDADHGVQWADFDADGDLDLALADFQSEGGHHLFRNTLDGEAAGRSIQVLVLDQAGHYTKAGSEVRVYQAGTREILGTGLVDTGSGYCSQNASPVHLGLASASTVDVEVITMTPEGRVAALVSAVSPGPQTIVVRVGPDGTLVSVATGE